MNDKLPHISIVVLNWNGHEDTIECLESVLKSDYQNFNVILIDNNSEKESVAAIKQWLEKGSSKIDTKFPELVLPPVKKPVKYKNISLNSGSDSELIALNSTKNDLIRNELIFITLQENIGFAKGSNLGFKFAHLLYNSDYVMALNNDTVIERDAIGKLIQFMEKNKDAIAATPAIYNYYEPEEIDNLGGFFTWTGRRDYIKEKRKDSIIPITFATGCALIIRLMKDNPEYTYFSEKFFFGEEDYEFCYRMTKAGWKLYCLSTSKVYHKINVSADKLFHSKVDKIFIYFLNRLINMKDFYPVFYWWIWMNIIVGGVTIWLFKNTNFSLRTIFLFIFNLYRLGLSKQEVNKGTVNEIKKLSFLNESAV
ncbi:MAG: glycosyltransferase family 2 protein [Calditrichia bacterium]